jgi:hypothetical protein
MGKSFRQVFLLILVASLLAVPDLLSPHHAGWADVGELPEPGGLVTPGDKTDEIRMKSESVLFSVQPDDGTFAEQEAQYYAHVTADFVMQNLSSKAVSKDLFFPFHWGNDLPLFQDPANAVMKQATNVKVLVEGREVQVSYAELAVSPQASPREKVVAAVFPVSFPAGRETAIQIEYDVRAVNEPKSSSLSFKYVMQTGSHWAGTIGSGKVIFEFWQAVDSKSALCYVNDFFEVTDGRLEWDFADLEPTPDHDITLAFEPTALESWAGRPSYVKDIRASAPTARAIPDSSPAYLLDTTRTQRGWVVEQAEDSGSAWLQFDLDRAHTVAGLRIRTGILGGMWDELRQVYDTFRRPKTVTIALSDGLTRTVTLEDMPTEWQMVSLPSTPTSSIRLSFLDSYPGTDWADAFLGVGRIQLIGVDANSTGEHPPGGRTGPNLLRNGDLEQGFDGQGIGLGWNGFSSGGGAAYTFRGDQWSRAVYQGAHSQLIAIATYALPARADRSAGIYQTVTGLEPGADYELSLAGLLREEASHPDEDPYRYRVQWALAEGDADWTHVAAWRDLPWDTFYPRTEPGAFSTYSTRLFASADSATLFIRAWKKWATSERELDVNLDTIALRKCEPQPVCPSWDLAHDMRTSPDQENPNRDSHGNQAVWHFMQRVNDGREAPTYELLPMFTAHAFGIQGLEQWTATHVGSEQDVLPAIGINATDQIQSYSTLAWPPHTVRVHPADAPVVVGWQSPISGQVRISGLVRDMDGHCGNGVLWSIDLGTTTLASGTLANGEAQGFAQGQGGTRLQSISVSKGEFLYFVVDPNGQFGCDSTELEIRIESTGCMATAWQPQSPPVGAGR